jgi:hypothetical protein
VSGEGDSDKRGGFPGVESILARLASVPADLDEARSKGSRSSKCAGITFTMDKLPVSLTSVDK